MKICTKCGRELNETAAFCPACGTPCAPQRMTPAGTGTPAGRPTSAGQAAPAGKKPHKVLIIILAVVAVLIFWSIVGRLFLGALGLLAGGNSNTAQKEESSNGSSEQSIESVDPDYDDVIRCIQGTWYGVNQSGEQYSFYIEGTDWTKKEELSAEVQNLVGTSTLVLDGHIEPTDRVGELQFIYNGDEVESTLYYKYDKNTDSIELTCGGNTLERVNVYERQ